MPELKILNSRKIKEIIEMIKNQWNADIELNYGFMQNDKDKTFLINKDISKIDSTKLRINSLGLYFCEIDKHKKIRLSIEGSQLVGPGAGKNLVKVNEAEAKKWLMGEDMQIECIGCKDYVILKHGNYFLGCGKYSNGKVLNFVGKTRRVSA